MNEGSNTTKSVANEFSKTHPRLKYTILVIAVLAFGYVSSKLYIWSKTQSTDNAYIETEISDVSSEINGVVKNVFVLDNTEVKQGDILAEIDDDDYKANLAKAEATVNAKVNNIKVIEQTIVMEKINLKKHNTLENFAKINFDLEDVDYKRVSNLNKDKFASKKLLDDSKLALEKAKSDYNVASLAAEASKENLSLLAMQKTVAEEELKALIETKKLSERALVKTKIIAPIDGVFANSNLQVGNYVRPGAVYFSIVPKIMHIKANFKETQVARFKAGHKAEIEFDALPGKKIYGKIRSVAPATGSKFSLIPPDNATGNFTKIVQRVPVIIDFEVPSDIKLVPGMSAHIAIRDQ